MRRIQTKAALALVWALADATAKTPSGAPAAAAPQAQAEAPKDPLGRDTPRGTVLGFLAAARDGEDEIARRYLNTRASGADARELTRQLFVVLDARLPARLTQLSDEPEGSRSNPLKPDQEIVGTITSGSWVRAM